MKEQAVVCLDLLTSSSSFIGHLLSYLLVEGWEIETTQTHFGTDEPTRAHTDLIFYREVSEHGDANEGTAQFDSNIDEYRYGDDDYEYAP